MRRTIAWAVAVGFVVAAPAARADEPPAPVEPEAEVAEAPQTEPAPKLAPGQIDAFQEKDVRPVRNVNVKAVAEVGAYQDSVATSVLTPSVGGTVDNPVAGYSVNGRYLVDMVSAASPDIVATASPRWSEVRQAGNLGARYKPGTFGGSVYGAVSYTPDYLSLIGGGQLIKDLDDKLLTLVAGYGYGKDTIGRTGTPFSVFSRDLSIHTISVGASRVVNPSLVIGVYADAIVERGDQSKPYRYIPIFTPDAASKVPRGASTDLVSNLRIQARPLEQLPLERERYALTGRLGYRGDRTTLRFEQRLYADTWGLRASTSDARYFVDVSERVTLWPHVRFHAQGGVDFWQRAYSAVDVRSLPLLRTGDRELGPLTNVGLGAGIRIGLGSGSAPNDLVLVTTVDGTWTSFADAIYVKERYSGIAVTSLEVTF